MRSGARDPFKSQMRSVNIEGECVARTCLLTDLSIADTICTIIFGMV